MSQPADVFSGTTQALIARGMGRGDSMFGGAPLPIKMAGRYFCPPGYWLERSAGAFADTAARYYIVPWYIDRPTVFAGAWCYNGGAGDNGDKSKMAIYTEAAAGGPGALAKSFGEQTFTGAAAVRTMASSWTSGVGMHYLEFVTDNVVTMYSMSSLSVYTAVGAVIVPSLAQMGTIGVPVIGATGPVSIPTGDYKDGVYANFPESTALTPTNTSVNEGTTPAFGLYT